MAFFEKRFPDLQKLLFKQTFWEVFLERIRVIEIQRPGFC
jgi:hypothetical protein